MELDGRGSPESLGLHGPPVPPPCDDGAGGEPAVQQRQGQEGEEGAAATAAGEGEAACPLCPAGERPCGCCSGCSRPPAVAGAPAPDPSPVVLKTPAYRVELPPCHGPQGPPLGELPATERVALPLDDPAAPARELPPRGKCLLGNWQEERATNHLDQVPTPELGPEGFFYRRGHQGLLSLHFPAGMAKSSTMKDSYRPPRRTGMPVRGQREAMMEWLFYQKHSKEVFEEQVQVGPSPTERQSITRRDYGREGFVSVPPAPTKPHDYRLEQPQSFWLEHARRVPGVSCVRTRGTPFRKCATFTTPEYLEQPYDDPETGPDF